MLAIHRKTQTPRKSPLQLGLFQPRDYEFDFRVILTNKVTDGAEAVTDFHHGRGSQEGLLGEAKSCAQMDYIPSRKLAVNQIFTVSAMLLTISAASCRCPPRIARAATPPNALPAGHSRPCTPFVTLFCVLVASRVPRAS